MFLDDWSIDIGHDTERLEKYHEVGFCPIHLGDRIAGRFTVLHKLGHGGFGTVWLVGDAAKRHGRYVALKVVSAEYSDDYEPAAVLERVKKYEHDHDNPGVFLVELERFFHTSRNGRHLCQVFPVLGPPLSELNTTRELLYPEYVRHFGRQLASGLATLHSLGACHGDFTLKNLAVKLKKPLDALTEQELLSDGLFGTPRTRPVDRYFLSKPSPGPQYVVGAANLTRLPMDYLSSQICVLDFDQSFLTENAPREVAYVPVPYLAPESIFAQVNSPAADVWALGCVLFQLRYPMQPFWSPFADHPEATARQMYHTLGPLPEEWTRVEFLNGWPVHKTLEPGSQDQPRAIRLHENLESYSLERYVGDILEPQRPAGSKNPRNGLENFCLQVPMIDESDHAVKKKFETENTRPIRKEDARLFADLLRKIFNYTHTRRITARQVLEHPWMREAGQKPCAVGVPVKSIHHVSLPTRTNNAENKIQARQQAVQTSRIQAQDPARRIQTPTSLVNNNSNSSNTNTTAGTQNKQRVRRSNVDERVRP